MSNEITIKDSASIEELKKVKNGVVLVGSLLEKKGVSVSGYVKKLESAIDRQISKERIQLLKDEQKKLRKGEASLFEPKVDEVVTKEIK